MVPWAATRATPWASLSSTESVSPERAASTRRGSARLSGDSRSKTPSNIPVVLVSQPSREYHARKPGRFARIERHAASEEAQSGAPASTSIRAVTASRGTPATRPHRTARPPLIRCIEAQESPRR
jgi:hypothetical protein